MKKKWKHSFNYQYKRNRLDGLLISGAPVTVVTAGTGHGKTQAVTTALKNSTAEYIIISLTPLDNYKQHFWDTFLSVISFGDEELERELVLIGFPDDTNTFFQFVNLLKDKVYSTSAFIIVLDNYHHINNNMIEDFIENLIMVNMEGLSFILISRLPVNFRAIKKYDVQIKTVTDQELAYTRKEIEDFFTKQGLLLSRDQMDALYQYTKGWVYAIHLAVKIFSEQNTKANHDELLTLFKKDVNAVMDTLIIKHYANTELEKIGLLSVLDFFPLTLARHFLESDSLLERSMADFLVCINEYQRIYVFSEISKNYFSKHISQIDQNKVKAIYITAGDWFLSNNWRMDALNCYRKGQAYKQCVDLLVNFVSQRGSWDTGRIMIETINEFPKEYKEKHPSVYVMKALFYFASLEYDKICLNLDYVIRRYEDSNLTWEEKSALADAHTAYALYYMFFGDVRFKEEFEKAVIYSGTKSTLFDDNFIFIFCGNSITLKDGEEGRIDEWMHAVNESAENMQKLINSGYGLPELVRAERAYLRGDFDEALLYAHIGLTRGKEYRQKDVVCSCYKLLNRISVARGLYEDAVKYLNEMWIYIEPFQMPAIFQLPDTIRNWFYLKLGVLDKVSTWNTIEGVLDSGKFLITIGMERIVYAERLLTEERYEEVLEDLEKTEKLYITRNLYLPMISVYLLRAIALDQLSFYSDCGEAFTTVYQMSYKNNIISPIIEYGAYICSVIDHTVKKNLLDIPETWLKQIYRKCGIYEKNLAHVKNEYIRKNKPVKEEVALSRLEHSILQMLSDGYTVKEIAEETTVPLGIVLRSSKELCLKLNAVNTAHAVKTAYERKLL